MAHSTRLAEHLLNIDETTGRYTDAAFSAQADRVREALARSGLLLEQLLTYLPDTAVEHERDLDALGVELKNIANRFHGLTLDDDELST